jgi:hypothetical protein
MLLKRQMLLTVQPRFYRGFVVILVVKKVEVSVCVADGKMRTMSVELEGGVGVS